MSPRSYVRRKPSTSSTLSASSASAASAIVERHLPDLYLAVGKDLFDRYIDEIVKRRLAALTAAAPSITRQIYQPPPRARERIDFLNHLVRKAPPQGIRCQDALNKLETVEERRITSSALREFIRRYMAHHELVVLSGYIRLKTEAVIELLAQERAKKIVEMKRAGEEGVVAISQ
jgi:hypothetical protein